MAKYNRYQLKNTRKNIIYRGNNYINDLQEKLYDLEQESCLGCTEGIECADAHKCTRIRNILDRIQYIKTNPEQRQLLKEERQFYKMKNNVTQAYRLRPVKGGKRSKKKRSKRRSKHSLNR